MKVIDGIPVYGPNIDPQALSQIIRCAKVPDTRVALMADHHCGYSVPIGGVVAYRNKVSPSGVGYDIGCGNKAVLTDLSLNQVAPYIDQIMDQVVSEISFGVGRRNNSEVDNLKLFDDRSSSAWDIPVVSQLKELAIKQLGTVGSGNHYVDIFADENERIWVGVHFGSRGFGHKIASHYLKIGGGTNAIDSDPIVFDLHSDLGQEYLAAMSLAGLYAYAGRDWVCDKITKILGGKILEEIHNHHNFAWIEEHFGELWCVVRKGATPAFPGQKGFVGGSMGDNSVILEGIDSKESKGIFYSTVHGAGRVMSRTEAAGRSRWEKGKKSPRSGGKVSRAMMEDWIKEKGVVLRGAGCDESPHCYKRLDEVIQEHSNTIKILHTLRPIGVAMASEEELDPYKD